MDNVDTPAHYSTGKIQPLDFIEDQKLGFSAGNVVKYVCRYRLKNGLEDLRKARVYLDRLIRVLEDCQPAAPAIEFAPLPDKKPGLYARMLNNTNTYPVILEGPDTVTVSTGSSSLTLLKRDCVLYTQQRGE